jgi:hypothetical protein
LIVDHLRGLLQAASYFVAIVAAILALLTYRANSQRERAKWAVQLYEKFYESDRYKEIRDQLDSTADEPAVKELVKQEGAGFTDYLNFFELVAYLAATKQLSSTDVMALFHYYLRSLKRHRSVVNYLNEREKGFERLSKLLNSADL